MIDKSHQGNKSSTKLAILSEFAPVPRQRQRCDGWTPDRQRGFIAALAETGSVKAAALAVNMAQEGAYQLRRHPEGGAFRKAWQAALELGVQRLEDVALDRALNGVEMPVYSYGKLVGTRIAYNDRLLMFLLRNRAPRRFGEGGRMNFADKASLANLKRQWRKQWERERYESEVKESKEARASFNEKLRKWMNEKTRELARNLRAEWMRLGGPPPMPGEEEEQWEDELDEDERDEDERDGDQLDADEQEDTAPEAANHPDAKPAAEPRPTPPPRERQGPRISGGEQPYCPVPNDGRCTPWP